MKLSRPFIKLPFRFDVDQLRREVEAFPADAWARHPNNIPGNSALRLITVGGTENDDVAGAMAPTPHLQSSPYIQQVLSHFGVVWSRSRLMRLGPGSSVPEHTDINYHWFHRVRLHVPIVTTPDVRFHCDGEEVHMAPGEAWIFDNWRRHHVENKASAERIHLVADTSGTAAFWEFARGPAPARAQWRTVAWNPASRQPLLTEGDQRSPVMPAAEVQLLIDDLRAELAVAADTVEARTRAARFSRLLEDFVFDWRQLCALHGAGGRGRPDFLRLARAVHEAARPLADGLVMRTNDASALLVLEKRVLQHLVAENIAP